MQSCFLKKEKRPMAHGRDWTPTADHEKALDYLEQYGKAVPYNAKGERILAEIADAGFARREGEAYFYTGDRPPPRPPEPGPSKVEHDRGTAINKLSLTQKKIIWAGIACLSFLAVFVPWKGTYGAIGYYFIFLPPNGAVSVDVTRLFIPMGLVMGLTVAAVVFAEDIFKKPGRGGLGCQGVARDAAPAVPTVTRHTETGHGLFSPSSAAEPGPTANERFTSPRLP